MHAGPQLVLQPIGSHPYASWAANTDPYGRYFIHFQCSACGDRSVKRCMSPARSSYWAMRYGQMHSHGLVATMR